MVNAKNMQKEDAPNSDLTIRQDTARRHQDKYVNRNPIHRLVLNRFFDSVAVEIRRLNPREVMDFGCGEGLFLKELKNRGIVLDHVVGIDVRNTALEQARRRCPEYSFEQVNLFTWNQEHHSFDLVIAAEVLEHVRDPDAVLEKLADFSRGHLLLTVPWEPWFQLGNFLRGRDLKRLGNHPEHVNRWTFKGFRKFVAHRATVERAYTVFPFSIVVAKIHSGNAA